MTESKIKVMLADDHQVMIDGLRALLQKETDIEIVAEANNGVEVLDKLHQVTVDVLVLDIGMPHLNGYDTVLEIQRKHAEVKVLILSLHKDEANIGKFLRENVSGYIVKDRGSAEIVSAIREVAKGNTYYDKEVTKVSVNSLRKNTVGSAEKLELTEREKDVLHFVAEGMTSRQIGQQLYISETTVETHKRNVAAKLGIKGSKQLMKYALEQGYSARAFRKK